MVNHTQEENGEWRQSLDDCKNDYNSYLTGNISLSDAEQACEDAKQNDFTPRWVGVVKDIYMDMDKGTHASTFYGICKLKVRIYM